MGSSINRDFIILEYANKVKDFVVSYQRKVNLMKVKNIFSRGGYFLSNFSMHLVLIGYPIL